MKRKEHVFSVPFDKTQRLRYLFKENELKEHERKGKLQILCSRDKNKVNKLTEVLKDILSKDEKVIIYVHSRRTVLFLTKELEKYFKDEIVTMFNSTFDFLTHFKNGNKNICIVIDGIMLFNECKDINHVIHYEFSLSKYNLIEREESFHNSVNLNKELNVYYLYCEGKADHDLYTKSRGVENNE